MGLIVSRLRLALIGPTVHRVVMVGLDSSGKTTLVHRLKTGEVTIAVPTTGFNIEAVQYRDVSFDIWDISGQYAHRFMWRHYFCNAQALIFVVNSADEERISLAREWVLYALCELKRQGLNAKLLILAHRQDIQGAMSSEDIADALRLNEIKDREWHIQRTSAFTGEGLPEALEWLYNAVTKV
ncbi:unnamed protein product [Heligmosomoides polygyrus]|uniref:ADP-ribosylation factor n=1 Tax=Heligmosomoides polygyrus TaxID=6339 RepID=A0A183F321_HELPZ|nr:unnamed protein product [Heligmosomoides polygyrus]